MVNLLWFTNLGIRGRNRHLSNTVLSETDPWVLKHKNTIKVHNVLSFLLYTLNEKVCSVVIPFSYQNYLTPIPNHKLYVYKFEKKSLGQCTGLDWTFKRRNNWLTNILIPLKIVSYFYVDRHPSRRPLFTDLASPTPYLKSYTNYFTRQSPAVTINRYTHYPTRTRSNRRGWRFTGRRVHFSFHVFTVRVGNHLFLY